MDAPVHYTRLSDGVNIACYAIGNAPPLFYIAPGSHPERASGSTRGSSLSSKAWPLATGSPASTITAQVSGIGTRNTRPTTLCAITSRLRRNDH
jgi:hypothetical protein